jgi:DNA-binding NarL/FixJ family response regulator
MAPASAVGIIPLTIAGFALLNCGCVFNGQDAIRLAGKLVPDGIIMEITMPVTSGLEAIERLSKDGHASKVLIFTTHESQTLPEIAWRIGAKGYVVKSQAVRLLITALVTSARRRNIFDIRYQKFDEQPASIDAL